MSHVLDDNVAPENCGGHRKIRETEDIALRKEIVVKDAYVCRRGKVTENYEEVARALMSTFIRARCCNSICSPRRRNSFTMA
jgi:hypothetical protein